VTNAQQVNGDLVVKVTKDVISQISQQTGIFGKPFLPIYVLISENMCG